MNPPAEAPIDRELAGFLARLHEEDSEELRDVIAALSQSVRAGDVCLPVPPDDAEALASHCLVGMGEDTRHPLVLDGAQLYLRRYWLYERRLAAAIRERVRPLPALDVEGQEAALARAVDARVLVVSGGPGTGKTTVAASMIRRLLAHDASLRIRLAAPTGKAAARLEESIRDQIEDLDLGDLERERFPTEASTIHRLLRMHPLSGQPRQARLPVDVLLIDEASMVDLSLMTKTVTALPPEARLILLGDEDQLASVEAGAVLAALCRGAGDGAGDWSRHVVRLTRNYRFGEDSGIGRLARAVRAGDADAALAVLDDDAFPDAAWCGESVPELARRAARPLLAAATPEAGFEVFAAFQMLCAVREGPQGVLQMNREIERALGIRAGTVWYGGRPVMVTVNDYDQELFNGDVGVAQVSPDGVVREVAFPGTEGVRRLHPSRLPEHETVHAMTVHKSQGSQFGEVVLVLPARPTPVLTRELLYTGVTRAGRQVRIAASRDRLREAVETPTVRHSGLAARIRDAAGG